MLQLVIVSLVFSTANAWHVANDSLGSEHHSSVRVSIRNAAGGPKLEVLRASPTSGYIQTPKWSYFTLHPRVMNSMVKVEIPKNHMVMFTILHLNLTGFRERCNPQSAILAVYKNSILNANLVWWCLDQKPEQRKLLSTGDTLFVHFQSWKLQSVGFKLFFSVHEESEVLQELGPEEDGVWNCSVANFKDFKPHFPCDMQPQCSNKEDERDCPYFSEDCGLGFASLGNYCLFLQKKPVNGTWRYMEYLCNKEGGTLVNIRKREEFKKLVRYLQPLADVWGFTIIRIGLHSTSKSLPMMYRQEFQHTDKTIAFYRSTVTDTSAQTRCGLITLKKDYMTTFPLCLCSKVRLRNTVLCERPKTTTVKNPPLKIKLHSVLKSNHSRLPLLRCPLEHVTRGFLACDFDSACWARERNSCPAPLTQLPPSFVCANGAGRVPYTLVCDVRPDCKDGSDESFCTFPPCALPDPFQCSDRQCVSRSTVCDGQKNCYNANDEDLCSPVILKLLSIRPTPPAVVRLSRHGQFTVHKLNQSELARLSPAECPETHFQCPGNGYCLPVFLRCNEVIDCPGREDEADCSSYQCPGFYRCRGSQACLHPGQLCDGVFQCLQNDDELLCDLSCPKKCTCYGLSLYCRQPFHAGGFRNLRFLDGRGSGMGFSDLSENVMLIYLSVAGNRLTTIGDVNFPNLHYLDLSDNQLKDIRFHNLSRLHHLKMLFLSGNPLLSLFQCAGKTAEVKRMVPSESENVSSAVDVFEKRNVLQFLHTLDLSRIKIRVLNSSFLSLMPNLHTVNMSGGGADKLLGDGFKALRHLRTLDLRGCPLTHFPREIFLGLNELKNVHSDNMKICCPATLPASFPVKNCHAPTDDLSSCEALLKSNIYRIFLSVFASLALLGNASSLFYRVFMQNKQRLRSFDVFVAHLCGADFLMGVYLGMIGVADHLYQGTYLWEDINWMNSVACQMAGVLSLLSSEVSALVICLITIDRFLVLRFPFSTFHFGTRSAHVACLCVWGMGFLVAAVPVAPRAAASNFYGYTGICIRLPVGRADVSGYAYAFGVMIVANFICFMVIAAGQVFIYWSVHNNSMSSRESLRKSQDVTIARRLITVAMSDFLCWFPIGLIGFMAATGTSISGEVKIAMAIFVLPINSALNPLIYTLNVALENRRRAEEERLKKRLFGHLGFSRNECRITSDHDIFPCI